MKVRPCRKRTPVPEKVKRQWEADFKHAMSFWHRRNMGGSRHLLAEEDYIIKCRKTWDAKCECAGCEAERILEKLEGAE